MPIRIGPPTAPQPVSTELQVVKRVGTPKEAPRITAYGINTLKEVSDQERLEKERISKAFEAQTGGERWEIFSNIATSRGVDTDGNPLPPANGKQ